MGPLEVVTSSDLFEVTMNWKETDSWQVADIEDQMIALAQVVVTQRRVRLKKVRVLAGSHDDHLSA